MPCSHYRVRQNCTCQVSLVMLISVAVTEMKTIARQDIWLAVEIRGCKHVGGRGVVDVGSGTVGGCMCTDRSEKAGLPPSVVKNTFGQLHDWPAELRAEVAVSVGNVL